MLKISERVISIVGLTIAVILLLVAMPLSLPQVVVCTVALTVIVKDISTIRKNNAKDH